MHLQAQVDNHETDLFPTLTTSNPMLSLEQISVVIPTYGRETVLINTLELLLNVQPPPKEVLLIDQTPRHEDATENRLQQLHRNGLIRWIRLKTPSITGAMNIGLHEARSSIVLFLDDDIIPDQKLISAHLSAHQNGEHIVAGQVLQPGESPLADNQPSRQFRFASSRQQHITELMGGNFSIRRELALMLGGFDENFVHVAYRFEAEFARRALGAGWQIFFEPGASIRHLKVATGGTRAYGNHLRTLRPSHSVGEYYFLLRSEKGLRRVLDLAGRPFRAIRTKHHATHPWWIPGTLAAEATGFIWAVVLYLRGPRLLNHPEESIR
jgi:GT2 family glycosyltransferase